MAIKDFFKPSHEQYEGIPQEDMGNAYTFDGDGADNYGTDLGPNQTSLSGDGGATIEMKVVKPLSYNIDEEKKFGDLLLEGKTVLLNLESTPFEDARRILDFLNGVVHAVDGKIEKVGKRTFVATPHNVDVTGSPDFSDEAVSDNVQ